MSMVRSRTVKRGLARAIALVFLLMIPWRSYAGHQDQDSFRIAVDVPLVVLHATVTDAQGSAVANLTERDFEVFENGVRQQIRLFKNEDIPVTVGLIVDHSTTMKPRISEVTTAARTFAQASNPEDEMFVVNFHETVSLGLPSAIGFTHDVAALQRAILLAPTGGETALYDAVALGLEKLRAGSRDKKVLVVVSDGGDNASKRNLGQVMKLAAESNAIIYTVGIFDADDPDQNPGVLKRLAHATGGEAYLPERVAEVIPVCERIARDVRHQYTIGYVPARSARDGSYRAIRVVAGRKGQAALLVRTRTGYIAGAKAAR